MNKKAFTIKKKGIDGKLHDWSLIQLVSRYTCIKAIYYAYLNNWLTNVDDLESVSIASRSLEEWEK